MALRQWRKFNFFELAQDIDGGALRDALQSSQVTCATSGRGCLIFGDCGGRVHFVSRQLEVVSHPVFDARVSHIEQLKSGPVIAAAGVDELGVASVKILSLEQLDGGGSPRLLRELKLPPPVIDGSSIITCLCVHEDLLFMAVGLQDGRVILWRGDVTRDRSVKQQSLHAGAAAVSGLGFRTIGKTSHLFLASTDDVVCYNITFKDKEHQIRLEQMGCAAGCAVMSEGLSEPQFTVGRTDAIYCYSANERGACFVFPGDKQLLRWFKGYLVVVGTEPAAAAAAAPSEPSGDRQTLTVYDVNNKYVAALLAAPLLRHVAHVVADWGQLHVVTADGKIHRLTEMDTQSKLEVLFRKNLYDMAIRLAQSQQYDAEGLVDIFRQYGDHLHAKGDYSAAVQQYIKTIGKLEPSYVIRKYLDTQRIRELTQYLQALHAAGRASADHATLLINCFTKLRDTEQLDKFIQGGAGAVEFDVDTAVRVCRGASYFEQALTIAGRHQQTDRVIAILTEDLADPQRALRYIAELPSHQCEEALLRHGSQLLRDEPDGTVDLLKKMCLQENDEGAAAAVPIEQYLELFMARPVARARFLQHLMETRPEALNSGALLSLLEAYLTCPELFSASSNSPPSKPAPPASKSSPVEPGSSPARSAFATVPRGAGAAARPPPGSSADASDGGGGAQTTADVAAADTQALVVQEAELSPAQVEAALRLLESDRLDLPLALHLCQLHGFQRGAVKLYERAGMHSQILHTLLTAGDYEGAIDTCRRYQDRQPHLWLDALRAVCAEPEPPADVIKNMLDIIEQDDLAPSLEVVDIITGGPNILLDTIRDYVTRVLVADQEAIDRNRAASERHRQEIRQIEQQIHDDNTYGKVFQRTTCAACSQPLELPSLHFFCEHSYHQHCFQSYTDPEENCPVCQAEQGAQNQDDLRALSDAEAESKFFEELGAAEDMFSVVAAYIGRGAFDEVDSTEAGPAEGAAAAGTSRPTYNVSDLLRSAGAGGEGVGAGAEARLRVADRSTGSAVMAADSEARVRTDERRSQPLQPVPEARLRAAQASAVAPAVAEGRLRAAQASAVAPLVPEARLRTAQASQPAASVSEGRVRAGQPSRVAASAAEGRVRAAETRPGAAPVAPTSGARHRLTEGAAANRAYPTRPQMAAPVPAKRPEGKNPFEEGPNPFDEDAGNPFLDDDDANNPFAEEANDDYDKSLNPFEE